ncbi:methyltransferase domain-containing protein [Novosphingobium sp. 1949]|uniref:Methyltransferase domain-containing protein n=1 Tax=Novosphingobium organovorum TaxID=2930092 RepID=A0ABT0BIX2_9SPHN|nr:class I SAM-dependent methyltransferase [Novosphingobium organovorum]MCJ2184985.1 methyltransferase domain-containing protein [Novosphingobium organovorum]
MTPSHDTVVDQQFGPQAQAYVESAVHAGGEDLDALESITARAAPRRALDIGTGGGHAAYRMARHAGNVTALDLSAAMLERVRATAHERGLANLEVCTARAERLPLDDGAFDMLATRYSAHHWQNFEQALCEARRVLEPGANAVFIDVISPGVDSYDTHLQTVELLRDPSHVRNRSEAEWLAALARCGFRVRATTRRRLRLEWSSWVKRMRTSDLHCDAIRSLQLRAPSATRAYFEIEPDGSFSVDTVQIEASACRAWAMKG